MKHNKYMIRAIELAEKGAGNVSPNPKVGAVIVKNGTVITEGWHSKFGGDHAEVDAIRKAGIDDFADCTLYVNLEPCSHYGKTPPCADLIISKNFSCVIVGSTDPNPLVSGKGITKLRDAGIEVLTDVCKDESEWCNRIFFKHITTGNPYIMLKIAQSLDGCIALQNGESKWITSDESRRLTHKLRNDFDAVLIGRTTALKDNPQLTVRSVEGVNPIRVVCDTHLSLPADLELFKTDSNTKTVVCCNAEAAQSEKAQNLINSGINVLPVNVGKDGRLLMPEVVKSLSENLQISSLMVEGGGGIYSSFLKSGLVDELQVFIAPKIFGKCRNPFDSINLTNINSAYQFKLRTTEMSGGDIHAVYVKV
ncbi:MAG: bifunctional diaminohydroxyphosphoribosylaminopyrimidine deaminase/5-amino-6-(5-phosphoribosylamino)uracil reductase RibD [Candidatus Kapabacteria bacterium]|nr:bifunctional diaminohydroxyphosphoribosylaminopyrimidine deaminase/5-amino-6-(5-phosphoribosylamino)uracil reductase RibD [Candidatus Kapabacteria bacterium]